MRKPSPNLNRAHCEAPRVDCDRTASTRSIASRLCPLPFIASRLQAKSRRPIPEQYKLERCVPLTVRTPCDSITGSLPRPPVAAVARNSLGARPKVVHMLNLRTSPSVKIGIPLRAT
eukprot:10079833-Alexandrium_andersonii.AAC.1